MKKVSLFRFSVTLLLCIGVLSVYLAPPRAASESGPPEGADPQQTPADCLQTFLSDVQECLLLPEPEQRPCIESSVQTLQACLGDGDGGEAIDIAATNALQFVLPDGSNNADVPLVINVGDTVRWTNTETLPHTVTSGTGEDDPAVGALFDRFLLAGGEFEYTFDTPGTFPYFCRIHDEMNMQGTVVVNEGGPGGGTAIPRDGWTIHFVDSELDNAPATHAIDGDPATFWRTVAEAPLPHELQINLGAVHDVSGFRYLPRQDSSNGRILGYEFYVSADGVNWGTPVNQGTFATDTSEQAVQFAAQPGQYVRLRVLSVQQGTTAAVAELNVLE